MNDLIYIILLLVAILTGLVFLLQLLNMVVTIYKLRGKATLSLWPPAVCALCLYLMTKL